MKTLFLLFFTFSAQALTIDSSGSIIPKKPNIKLEFEIDPIKESERSAFESAAKKQAKGSIIALLDIDGDDIPEKFVIRPGKDNDCDFTGRDNDCDGLITTASSTTAESDIVQTRIDRNSPASGQATGKRGHRMMTQTQIMVEGFNGSLSIKKIKEIALMRKHVANIKYETFSLELNNPTQELADLLRKGWDGTVKGGSKRMTIEIKLLNELGKEVNSLKIQKRPAKGKVESCDSNYLCGKTDHL